MTDKDIEKIINYIKHLTEKMKNEESTFSNTYIC